MNNEELIKEFRIQLIITKISPIQDEKIRKRNK